MVISILLFQVFDVLCMSWVSLKRRLIKRSSNGASFMCCFDKIFEHLVLSFMVILVLQDVLDDLLHLSGILVLEGCQIVWKTTDAIIGLLLHQSHIMLDLHVVDPRLPRGCDSRSLFGQQAQWVEDLNDAVFKLVVLVELLLLPLRLLQDKSFLSLVDPRFHLGTTDMIRQLVELLRQPLRPLEILHVCAEMER